jgi:hypothetical protein
MTNSLAANYLGLFPVAGLALVAALLVSKSRLAPPVKLLIYLALIFRFVGAWVRLRVAFDVYGGPMDASVYSRIGVQYADRFLSFDFSPIFSPDIWIHGRWWGGQFMYWVSGIVYAFTGPSMLGAFAGFSMLSFIGLVGFGFAFHRSFPHVPVTRYLRWIWFFPSLWFWPSSVGKEAVMIMGIGLSIWGFIGKNERINWPLLCLGLFFVMGIRPQVAAVVILSLVLGHWLSLGGRWNLQKSAQGAVILAVGLAGIYFSMKQIGVEGFDIEGVEAYLDYNTARSNRGTKVEVVGVGLANIPIAMVNILFRPFPWEASNSMALLSALELWGMWALVWFKRKTFFKSLRNFRSNRSLRVAVPFILVYSITLGMLIVNLGIIARQRIFLFPFLFLLMEAVPRVAERHKRQHVPLARPLVYPPGPRQPAIRPRV